MGKFLFFMLVIVSSNNFATYNILILGDSLSASYGIEKNKSWVALLQNEIPKPWRLINASISGDTSENGLLRLPSALLQYRPKIVLVELGANDGLRGLSLKALRHNLAQIISKSQHSGAQVLIAEMKVPPNYGKRYSQLFANIFSELSQQFKIPRIPFFLQNIANNPGLMLADGLHPNTKAQPIIAKLMQHSLLKLLH